MRAQTSRAERACPSLFDSGVSRSLNRAKSAHKSGQDRQPSARRLDVLELEDATRADVRAHPAAHARSAGEALVSLGVRADVDAHLAIGAAVATRDAHVRLHADPKAPELLDEPERRRHRTEI